MLQFCVCKSNFRDDNSLHVSISVFGEASVWQAKLLLGCMYLMVRVHLAAECDITITNGARSQWRFDVPIV